MKYKKINKEMHQIKPIREEGDSDNNNNNNNNSLKTYQLSFHLSKDEINRMYHEKILTLLD